MHIADLMGEIKNIHASYTENKSQDGFTKSICEYEAIAKKFVLSEKDGIRNIYTFIEKQRSDLYPEKTVKMKKLADILNVYKEYTDGMFMFANEFKTKSLSIKSNDEAYENLISKLTIAMSKDGPFIDSLFSGTFIIPNDLPMSVAVENLSFISEFSTIIKSFSKKVDDLYPANSEDVTRVISLTRNSIEQFAYQCLIFIIGSYTEIQNATTVIKSKPIDNSYKLF